MDKLTAKEEEVMEMIWQIGPCAPKDVVAEYKEPKPHINTIATMFQSLERKGYLTHEPKGRGYIYSPAIEQKDYGQSKFSNFVHRYFDNSYMNVVSALVQEEKISRSELMDFLEQMEKRK
ncbi:MAG: BlaI/MecI/CopY family transcriptional regulator [Bacteroidaceae bacterium]|jgi:predicted transcriptional regulator|nr:BlaI/MecI/CopY family transcriptional regulator [Bacteroidaceae bacterium]